jgi:electron transfer flavoprotein alpha subunit
MKTFVYIDHFKGEVQPASWEALGLAKSFGTAVALVFGAGVDEVAKAAVEFGADEVLVADDASLQITALRRMPPPSPRSPLPKART